MNWDDFVTGEDMDLKKTTRGRKRKISEDGEKG